MKRRILAVIRSNHFVDVNKMVLPENEKKYTNDLSEAARDVMDAHGYKEYIQKHGYHFTDRLSEYASRKMENSNGSEHSWTTEQVKEAVKDIPHGATYGDMTYLANMAYSDFYPHVLGTVSGCLAYAKAVAEDRDGYEGLPFMRWIADLIGKKETVNWVDFIDGE